MSSETMISVRDVGKTFHIYANGRERLKQFLLPRVDRALGREPSKYFHEVRALRNVSFDVVRGETVGIVGRNGSGKSTLLQIICGTLNPSGGSVEVKGRVAALLELGSGFNPEFTGRENVYLNGALLGLRRAEIDDRFEEIAAFADIGEFIEHPVKTYSSGMIVRLAFAVQATVDPNVLVVDEALAVGDEKFQRKCFARIEALKSRGTSILFVSHSGPQVIELCDRAVLLESGERLLFSKPEYVVRSYQRLIYAVEPERTELLRRFRLENSEGEGGASSPAATGPDRPAMELAGLADQVQDEYDPGLVPDSTTVYPELGCRIEAIEIRSESGDRVNVLRPRGRYRLEVRGRFLKSLEKVYFGVHIRSISGAVVSGQRFPPEGTHVENVRAGETFTARFWFEMALLPGAYFCGGGVWSLNEPACRHRILDAMMFRIRESSPGRSFGYCDLACAPAELAIEPR
jgi:lipopolysaccharide transport system ATP-binding protein